MLWQIKFLRGLIAFAIALQLQAVHGSVALHHNSRDSFFTFRPGILVDLESGGQIYHMSPAAGVEAISLKSGERIWHSPLAKKPLVKYKNLLIAQAASTGEKNFLKIVALSLEKAREEYVFQIDVELPADVDTSIEDKPYTTFLLDSWLQGDKLILDWKFARQEVLHTDFQEPFDVQEIWQNGVVEIDLQGQNVLKNSIAQESARRADIPDVVSRHIEQNRLSGTVIRGERVYALVRRKGKNAGVKLYRWELNGQALPPLSLFGDSLVYRYPSADERHLLASKLAERAEDDGPPGFVWSIHSVDTGEEVAQAYEQKVGSWFFIRDGILVTEDMPGTRQRNGALVSLPYGLQAKDVASGEALWFIRVRNLKSEVTLPPGNQP